MTLEAIARIYGMVDYYDSASGQIYELSNAFEREDGLLLVPVKDAFGDNILVGYACMEEKVEQD